MGWVLIYFVIGLVLTVWGFVTTELDWDKEEWSPLTLFLISFSLWPVLMVMEGGMRLNTFLKNNTGRKSTVKK